VTRPAVPPEVLEAAHARRAARIGRDWPEADRLRASIEAAGWRVVDRGADFSLEPAHPPTVTEGGEMRYGSSSGVPSRRAEPDGAPATLVVVAPDPIAPPSLKALRVASGPEGQVLVVADDPASGFAAALRRIAEPDDTIVEVVMTSARLGPGACLNIGLRRAIGSLIVVLGPASRPSGDLVAAVRGHLERDGVAVVGAAGLVGPDVRHLRIAGPGDVAALDGRCIAVRRSLALRRGPVDERFGTWSRLATGWTLALRDEGEDQTPLRALALDDLPLVDVPVDPSGAADAAEDPRLLKRDRYRLLDRYGRRPDLFEVDRAG
jgi:hypothetical protein